MTLRTVQPSRVNGISRTLFCFCRRKKNVEPSEKGKYIKVNGGVSCDSVAPRSRRSNGRNSSEHSGERVQIRQAAAPLRSQGTGGSVVQSAAAASARPVARDPPRPPHSALTHTRLSRSRRDASRWSYFFAAIAAITRLDEVSPLKQSK